MSRGVLAVFGQVNKESFQAIKLFSNSYNLPFFTWSAPILSDESIGLHLEDINESSGIDEETEEKTNNNVNYNKNFQLFLQPDLGDTLIFLMKQNNWNKIYYIYNYAEAYNRINNILNFQTDEVNYVTEIHIRKVEDVLECQNLLRFG